jgi:hypothetical protein
MTSDESPVERLRKRSDDDIVSDHLCVVTEYFSDVFSEYAFVIKTKTVDTFP